MSDALKISISGIRGIVGHKEGLTPDLILNFGKAFGSFIKGGKIIIGSDTRPTYKMVKHAIAAGLMSSGCEIIDIGIVPTPTVLFMVKNLKANGGIAITASHNPIQWNALKLISKKGTFLNQNEGEKVLALFKSGKFNPSKWNKTGKEIIIPNKEIWDKYINPILNEVDVAKIRSKKFKVAMDPVNGAGCNLSGYFLEKLGCTVTSINNDPTGYFGRKPEPLPENLKGLSTLVKSKKADIGFAQDPDADRLAIVSEKGFPLGEEYTLALAIDWMLKKNPKYNGPIVLNTSSSLAGEKIAAQHGLNTIRTKVGEINVTSKMLQVNALIGGEGNGGVIFPKINPGRDSFVGMALVLEYMAVSGEKISKLKTDLPQYSIVKKTMPASGLDMKKAFDAIKTKFSSYKFDTLDGLKIIMADSWVILRASNTEPIVRVVAEAPTAIEASKLADSFIKELKAL